MTYRCPHCKRELSDRVTAQLHYATCDQKPLLRKLSVQDRQRLLNRAREIDVAAGREARK